MLSYIPGKRYKFDKSFCENCRWNTEACERCGNPEYMLYIVRMCISRINVFSVDSASRKKIVNYYNKIEQEVLNGKEKS